MITLTFTFDLEFEIDHLLSEYISEKEDGSHYERDDIQSIEIDKKQSWIVFKMKDGLIERIGYSEDLEDAKRHVSQPSTYDIPLNQIETEWSYFYSTLSVLENAYKDFPIERKKLTYLAVSENGTFRFITANSSTEAHSKYHDAFLNNEDYGTHLFQILSVPVTDDFNLWTLFPSLEDFHDDSQGYPYFSNYCHHNGL